MIPSPPPIHSTARLPRRITYCPLGLSPLPLPLPIAIVLLPCLLLSIVVVSSTGSETQLVEEVEFGNVTFVQSIQFGDNTSLAQDVTVLDSLFKLRRSIGSSNKAESSREGKNTTKISRGNGAVKIRAPLVRLLLVGDHSMYEHFLALHSGDEYSAYNGLKHYLEGLFDQLETIFDVIRLFNETTRLHLQLTASLPIVRPEDCPLRGGLYYPESNASAATNLSYVDSIDLTHDSNSTLDLIDAVGRMPPVEPIREWKRFDGLEAVHAVHEWALRHGESLPNPFHHVLVITKLDLLSQKNNDSSTQGMAYVRSMCRGAESASVVEDIGGLATSAIAAHELVHSLGAFHDGSSGGGSESATAGNCSAKDGYLMAPSSSSGNDLTKSLAKSFQLSECSQSEVEQFLNSTDADCLWTSYEANSSNLRRETRKLGERFSLTRQCQIAFGSPKYAHCRNNRDGAGRRYYYVPPGADPCRRLWCKNRGLGRHAPCETKAFLPLADGSECGEGRWCISGSCTARAAGVVIPARLERPCRDLNRLYCQTLPAFQMRLFCRSRAFSRVCCATCDQLQRERSKASRVEL